MRLSMANPSDTTSTPGTRHRRPRAGERTRGAVDALQTKIAVNLQNLQAGTHRDALQANVAELPDAAGCDAAFLALAEILAVPLITCDARLARAPGHRAAVEVFPPVDAEDSRSRTAR